MTQIKMYQLKLTKKPIPVGDTEVRNFMMTQLFYYDEPMFTYKLTKKDFKAFKKETLGLAKHDMTDNRMKKLKNTLNDIEKKLGNDNEILLTL